MCKYCQEGIHDVIRLEGIGAYAFMSQGSNGNLVIDTDEGNTSIIECNYCPFCGKPVNNQSYSIDDLKEGQLLRNQKGELRWIFHINKLNDDILIARLNECGSSIIADEKISKKDFSKEYYII